MRVRWALTEIPCGDVDQIAADGCAGGFGVVAVGAGEVLSGVLLQVTAASPERRVLGCKRLR